MEIVGGKSVMAEIRGVVGIGIPIPDTLPPTVLEIRSGMVSINRVGEGGDKNTEVRFPFPPGG